MLFSDRLLDPLMKRGVGFMAEYTTNHIAKGLEKRQESGGEDKDFPTGIFIAVVATIFVFVVSYGLIEYTLRHVVTTLALVETPSPAVALSAAQPDEESNVKLSDKEAEAQAFLGNSLPKLTVVNSKPVTSKIRTTIKHITSQAGWTARWRGMGYGIIFCFVAGSLTQLFATILPSVSGAPILANLLVAVIAAPVHMVWTHATIALPGKRWKARWAPATFASYKNLAIPALVYEGVQLLVLYMAACMAALMEFRITSSSDATPASKAWTVISLIGGVLLLVAAGIFVILPAHTQLVRVEASMLSDDEDTIVPFDRTFGGKVVPKILGGSGAIGFMDAWRSFNREARIRVVKLHLKIFAISAALTFLFFQALALEVLVIGRQSVDDFAQAVQQHMVNGA
ncbi:hypothetical protein GTA08_BOTSDO03628 [Neofusicoccum parvum]|uniref:Ubiquitin carrier protein n=2 Tax=Neofusicoccum TaxID=407951 RepID=R1GIV8_BOTPV|nr:hypothetical protein UCRNP2_1604 [Neofusicoccum parvum UCRNP2]GME37109.1 hypothetical protein GTA08_BOTSDO03628 [Neofusicoccum parvum]